MPPLLFETIALAAALGGAAVALARAARLGVAAQLAALLGAIFVAVSATGARHATTAEGEIAWRPVRSLAGGYVGSDACRSCHPREYATWHASYHRTMTQLATPQNIAMPFDGVMLSTARDSYRLLERAGSLWVEMRDLYHDGPGPAPTVRRRIVLTTGSHHEQDFWFEAGPGRAVAHFPFVYRIPERRWMPNGSTFVRPPIDPDASPRPEAGGWNRNCIQCHATGGVPRFAEDGSVQTTVSEFGIACEACHGPAAEHVTVNRDPRRRFRLRSSDEAVDGTIVNAARLEKHRSGEVCGQCHMVSTILGPHSHPQWNARGPSYRPGDELAASRDIVQPAIARHPVLDGVNASIPGFVDDRFWGDGMIRVSGREFHGLLETPCFKRGPMTCLSCHRMHADAGDTRPLKDWADDQLAAHATSDGACARCHPDLMRDVPAHTHHEASSEGSRCFNCHMPHTTYGLLKAIRSHQVSNPSVVESRDFGRPNACNLCHLDRTLEWTGEQLSRWYGTAPIALAEDDRTIAAAVRWTLEGDAGQRVLMAWHLGWQPALLASRAQAGAAGQGAAEVQVRSSWVEPYLAHLLDDPYDAVRFVAEQSLRRLPGGAALDYDCMAPALQRAQARRRLLAGTRVDVARLDDPQKLLFEASGAIDRERFDRLSARRNERRVELRE